MRILSVVHAYPPFSRAGAENCVEALSREQRRRGHDARVFHRIADPSRPEYELSEDCVDGVPVQRINRCFSDLARFEDTYRSEAVARALGRVLDSWAPEVVHFHHVTCLSTTCVHEVARRGIPVVFTLHDFWLLCPRGQLLRRDLSRCDEHTRSDCVRCMAHQLRLRGGHAAARALWKRASRLSRLKLPGRIHRRLASRPFADEEAALEEIAERERHVREMCSLVDLFVAPSRFLRERFVEFGVRAERVEVLDNGFDPTGWSRRAPDRERSGPLRVAYLGTWIPSKGVHVLIEAFREIDPREAVLEVHGAAVPYDGWEDYGDHLAQLARGFPMCDSGGATSPKRSRSCSRERTAWWRRRSGSRTRP